ncbi:A disintegrin and metalloproteinase with thrombospondin motifs 7-like isoform X2 [Actinia tenebrosa]|nr:A disintegrin and metalloproteinase with thrombospondin motifs 7-like isoform X2 [Actinia tenebrosa]
MCFYSGKSKLHSDSSVAIGNCHGLLGVIRMGQEEYFIEPMEKKPGKQFAHVLYRRSDLPTTRSSTPQSCSAVKDPGRRRFNNTNITDNLHHGSRNRRSVVEITLQLLVVVDKDMIDFHGNDTIEEYVLTIMNMVSEIYRDPSIGVAINLEVIRLILLYNKQKQLSITSDGHETLQSFCEWQNSLRWREGEDPQEHNHYDAAVLITRQNICADKTEKCATVGMGYLYGMCDLKRRCSVSEDNGLNVAFTIAHELGHNLGIYHDGEGNSCSDFSGEIPHLMSARWLLRNKHGGMKWSQCSKRSLKAFLKSEDSKCLRRHSKSKKIALPPDLPGVRYSADDQCRLQYGNRARHCLKFKAKLCRELWCEIEGEQSCRSKLNPPAKGTACGRDKWCMFGSCVENTIIPQRRDGDWTDWSGWSKCSRSCGSGVMAMQRKCNNPRPLNGGRYCIGEEKRYKLCNIQPCPKGSQDFRVVQCSSYNNTKYKGVVYEKWVPVISDGQPCALFCRPEGTNHRFSAKLAENVVDGTTCRADTRNVCIDGKCHSVGCDNKLGSGAKEDVCGVCKGNGTTCYTVEGRFNQLAGKGYVEAALIPKGARAILVTEVKPCTSFLALRSRIDKYYINGNKKIELPGDFDAEGTIFKYFRSGTWERLIAKGPTTTPFHIMVLYNGFNLGIKYRYTLPINTSKKAKDKKKLLHITGPTYGWVHGGWSPCSAHCDGGIRKSLKMKCVGFYRGEISFVEDFYCKDATKPQTQERVCNVHKCAIWWDVSPWQPCSTTCGGGVQKRLVTCKQEHRNGSRTLAPDHRCTDDKPSSLRNCIHKACHLKWRVGRWSRCYALCGVGVRRRSVTCPAKNMCSLSLKPTASKPCYSGPCLEWVTGEWSKCSARCGPGYQRRLVTCRHKLTGKKSNKCEKRKQPMDVKACKITECTSVQEPPCLQDKYNKKQCHSVLKYKLCHDKAWYSLCCKTCERIARPR